MNESQWLACDDPGRMLRWFSPHTTAAYEDSPSWRISDRKLRLFAVACCRQLWPYLDERGKSAITTAEQYADGEASLQQLMTSHVSVSKAALDGDFENVLAWQTSSEDSSVLLENRGLPSWFSVSTKLKNQQCSALRDIVGNPFRPTTLPRAEPEKVIRQCPHCRRPGRHCSVCHGTAKISAACGHCFDKLQLWIGADSMKWVPCTKCPKGVCSWLTPLITTMASTIYNERTFEDMPILADALEDVGCDNMDILDHCRERCFYCKDADFELGDSGLKRLTPAQASSELKNLCVCKGTRLRQHYRGCWVLDLLLNKE